jgi:DNA/RNA endonuclease G (NUC1)
MRLVRRIVAIGLAFGVALGAGCAAKRSAAIKFSTLEFPTTEALSKEDEARLADNCPFGAPRPLSGWPLGKTDLVFHDGYVLEHSVAWKVPFWVCESLEDEELNGNRPRRDLFKADPALSEGRRSELTDYKGLGFDRGHMAPAGDRTKDQRLKDETFFLSNMIPQVGAHNQRIWAALEDLVRSWAADNAADDVKVITGPVFHTEEDLKAGFSTVTTIGENGVGVPKRSLQDRRRQRRWRTARSGISHGEPRLSAAVQCQSSGRWE